MTAGCTLLQDVQHDEAEHARDAEQPALQQDIQRLQAQLQVHRKAHDLTAYACFVQPDVCNRATDSPTVYHRYSHICLSYREHAGPHMVGHML